jgi:hypothetical protein
MDNKIIRDVGYINIFWGLENRNNKIFNREYKKIK